MKSMCILLIIYAKEKLFETHKILAEVYCVIQSIKFVIDKGMLKLEEYSKWSSSSC
jgi:hypothetical protein